MTCHRVRAARAEEADALTQIAVRATIHDGYDEGVVARFMPALRVNLPLIAAGLVFVGENERGDLLGYAALRPTGMEGLVLLEGIFVDPVHARRGVGKRLFAATVELSRKMTGNVILVYSNPNAVDFYIRLGGTKIGETPFVFSPDVQLSMFVFSIPPLGETAARAP